jgi:hypothetical protein
LLADSRFLLAAVAVPRGGPVFRWQELNGTSAGHASRAQCLENWIAQGRPNLAPLLPSCGFELLLPDAFYVSLTTATADRPYAVRAAWRIWRAPRAMRRNCARWWPGGRRSIEEYRIGLR